MTEPTAPTKDSGGWSKKELHVMSSLARIEEGQAVLHDDVKQLRTEVAKLQVKSGILGLVGGMIPMTGAALYLVLS